MTSPAPAAGSGGGMGARAGTLDDRGLLYYIDTLRDDATSLREEVLPAIDRRIAAADGQPLSPAVVEAVNQAKALVSAAATALDEGYAAGRRHHEVDYERAEDPRGGSVTVEAKADAQTSENDRSSNR